MNKRQTDNEIHEITQERESTRPQYQTYTRMNTHASLQLFRTPPLAETILNEHLRKDRTKSFKMSLISDAYVHYDIRHIPHDCPFHWHRSSTSFTPTRHAGIAKRTSAVWCACAFLRVSARVHDVYTAVSVSKVFGRKTGFGVRKRHTIKVVVQQSK